MSPHPLRSLVPLLLLCFVPLAACTGEGDGDSASLPAAADVLLTDAPADDLLFLRAEVESVVLERTGGSLTDNLLGGPVPVDLLSLSGVFEWLLSGQVGSGPVVAVQVGFDPAGFAAADKHGTPVTIVPAATVLRVEFPAEIVLDPQAYTRIEIDFDLSASLAGSVSSGTLTLTPAGSAASSGGSGAIPIDEIKGEVVSADALAATIVLDAFADGDLDTPLGTVTAEVLPAALLVDEDGSVFASVEAFFAALVPGASVLEVHGTLAGGAVDATKIEVEDAFGLGGLLVAEIRGKVIGHAPGASLELLIQEVEMGLPVVLPVLSLLGDPASITVGIDPGTVFFLEHSESALEDALAVGQAVVVEFSAFSAEPFPALKIEIEDEDAEFEGFVTDAAGLPADLVIHLQDGDPALLAGLVASSSTDVTVDVTSAVVALKLDGEPSLATADLTAGLRVEVHGALSGTPSAPSIAATRIEVIPGLLDGAAVAGTAQASSLFMTTGGTIDDPFGGGITEGPLDVVVEPGCTFGGAADSESTFFALTGLVSVRVEGVASGNPGEIRAFSVISEN